MAALLKESGLRERIAQDKSGLRVTRGGREITLEMLNEGDDWRSWPGVTRIEPVRIVNRVSRNGTIYESPAMADIERIINSGHYISAGHEDEYANRQYPDGFRPERSRFARAVDARAIEEDGLKVAVDAAMEIDEGERELADRYAVKALRDPKSVMLSIETPPPPAWDGYRDEGNILHVTEVQEMLDTATVTNGGTTKSLQENSKQRRQKMDTGVDPKKLLESEQENKKLLERCTACESEAKIKDDEIASLKEQLAELQQSNSKLAELEEKVQESERRQAISKKADKMKIGLKESKLDRLVALTDKQVDEELEELKGLQENKQGFTSQVTGADEEDGGFEMDYTVSDSAF